MTPTRLRIITLGCKVNQCDADEMAGALAARGCQLVGRNDTADIHIINTCTVTGTADAKARKLIRKLAREHPRSMLIVTGCGAERHAEAVRLPGLLVVPNARKGEIGAAVARATAGGHAETCAPYSGRGKPLPNDRAPAELKRTRAFLKIQDGCDHHCTYCIVPEVRGRPISKPLTEAIEEMGRLADGKVQEVVLCGIRLGAYGKDGGEGSLAALLHELRDTAIPRLRLSSLEPMDVDDDLLAEIADHPRLCHHLHLPLQSGDDAVLSDMGRGYTRGDFADLVSRIRAAWPDAAISTDVMVAFPGETDEQFQHTADFFREMAFSRLHAFPYSPRPDTPAARRPDHIPAEIRRERTQHILALADELARAAARNWIGKEVSVLFEQQHRDGRLTGLTEHYIRVECAAPIELIGRIAEVLPTGEVEGALVGELAGSP